MKEITVSCDTGKGFTKYVTRHPESGEYLKSTFPTKVQKVVDLGLEVSKHSFLVDWNGESWLVGDMLSNRNINTDLTKKTNEHLLCINLAIAEAIRKTQQNIGIFKVNLAVNCPLTIMKNMGLRKEYEDFIRQEGHTVYLTVNNEHFLFVINKVISIQEGLGALFVRPSEFRERLALQIDVGTLNCTVSLFDQLVPQIDSNFSNNFGTQTLFSQLREQLSTHFGRTVHAKDMEQVIKDRSLIIEGEIMDESTAIIQEAMMNHAKEIVSSIKSQISLNNTRIYLVGGGSILLREQLQTLLPHAIFESDPQFSSIMSFHRILEAKLHAQQV